MKNRKKLLFLLIGILICILLFFIVQIYAKYLTSASGNTNIGIAKWDIVVNDLSIKNNTDISNKNHTYPQFVRESHQFQMKIQGFDMYNNRYQ